VPSVTVDEKQVVSGSSCTRAEPSCLSLYISLSLSSLGYSTNYHSPLVIWMLAQWATEEQRKRKPLKQPSKVKPNPVRKEEERKGAGPEQPTEKQPQTREHAGRGRGGCTNRLWRAPCQACLLISDGSSMGRGVQRRPAWDVPLEASPRPSQIMRLEIASEEDTLRTLILEAGNSNDAPPPTPLSPIN